MARAARGTLNFDGKKIWRSKKYKDRLGKPGPEKVEGYVRLKDRKVAQVHNYAFIMCLRSEARQKRHSARKKYELPQVNEQQVHKYIDQPEVRYEFDGKKIIRTVSAFHYISKHTTINGLCRSFCQLNGSSILTGDEKIKGVNPRIVVIFNKRYFVGRFNYFSCVGSDLDREIRGYSIVINNGKYHIVQMKNILDDKWTFAQLFKSKTTKPVLNHTVEIKMSQKEIIEKIKSGEITEINEFGNPKKVYTPKEVLEKLGL